MRDGRFVLLFNAAAAPTTFVLPDTLWIARWDGNVSHAARALGLSRSALYRRMAHYGL